MYSFDSIIDPRIIHYYYSKYCYDFEKKIVICKLIDEMDS